MSMNETLPVSITGINIQRSTAPGRRIIAHFDVEIIGIQIRGCALVRTAKSGLTFSTPSVDALRAQRGVSILSPELFNLILSNARQAYEKMGGTDLPTWARSSHEAEAA